LQTNKARFELDSTIVNEPSEASGGRSNAKYIENRLKDKVFKNCKTFTDTDEEFIEGVKNMLANGTIAKRTSQDIKKELEKTIDPMDVLHILRKHIRSVAIETIGSNKSFQRREVILSGYLIK